MRVRLLTLLLVLPACVGQGEQARSEQPSGEQPSGEEARNDQVSRSVGGETHGAQATADPNSGAVLGVKWKYEEVDGQRRLHLGDKMVLLDLLEGPCYATDELMGCWDSPAAVATAILRFHPDHSALAKPTGCVGIGLRVIGSDGFPVASVRVTPSVSAVIVPASGKKSDSNPKEVFVRPIVDTDAHGDACVPDDRAKVADLRGASSASSRASGRGTVDADSVKMTLQVEHAGFHAQTTEVGDHEIDRLLVIELAPK